MKIGLMLLVLAVMVGACSPMAVTHYDGRSVSISWERGIGRDNNATSVQARADEICGGPARPLPSRAFNHWAGGRGSTFLCTNWEHHS